MTTTPEAPIFTDWLQAQGLAPSTTEQYVKFVKAAVPYVLTRFDDLDTINAYLRKFSGSSASNRRSALMKYRQYLGIQKAGDAKKEEITKTLDVFGEYLDMQGLSMSTANQYVSRVAALLRWLARREHPSGEAFRAHIRSMSTRAQASAAWKHYCALGRSSPNSVLWDPVWGDFNTQRSRQKDIAPAAIALLRQAKRWRWLIKRIHEATWDDVVWSPDGVSASILAYPGVSKACFNYIQIKYMQAHREQAAPDHGGVPFIEVGHRTGRRAPLRVIQSIMAGGKNEG